jgi:CheY-like chemotaxis protein
MKTHYPNPNLPPYVIVDDCDDDTFLLRHRLREGGVTNPIHAFGSPAAALAFLRSVRNRHELPAILFTDIRMPVDCGLALISAIREHREWDGIRIAVMTTSNDPVDLQRALENGANAYLIKFPPSDILSEFVRNGPWISSPRPVHALVSA